MSERVVVACGGRSMEREISMQSGQRAVRSLQTLGYRVDQVDPDASFVNGLLADPPAFVFVAMHGRGGEDGTLQDLLEILEIPYTGSDIHASARCLDKHSFKEMLSAEGLSTPAWHSFNKEAFAEFGATDTLPTLGEQIGYPMVIKPAREGSSLGLTVIRSEDEFPAAVVGSFSYDDRVLIEEYVEGRELAISILGSTHNPLVLPIVEITTSEPYYTFTAHYELGAAELRVAELSENLEAQVRSVAQRAYVAAGCRDLARVDIRLDEASVPQILEINTIPGLTETGPTPFAADAAGLSFDELIERVISRVSQ